MNEEGGNNGDFLRTVLKRWSVFVCVGGCLFYLGQTLHVTWHVTGIA